MRFTFFLTFWSLLLISPSFGQGEEDLIRHSIHNYFNGTSFNHISQIEAAFYPDATLYLETGEGVLKRFSVEEYVNLFRKNTPGKFNGRYNKILSIEIEGNLAQVKAEILMPARKRRYIDVFIFRKMEEGLWQIVSKAANSSAIKADK